MEGIRLVYKGGVFINEVGIILAIIIVVMLLMVIALCQVSGKISRLEEMEYLMLKEKELNEENSEVSQG